MRYRVLMQFSAVCLFTVMTIFFMNCSPRYEPAPLPVEESTPDYSVPACAPPSQFESMATQWGFFSITDAGGATDGLCGVKWSRHTGLIWPKIEPSIGSEIYDWNYLDPLIIKAQDRGYNLILVLKTSNSVTVSERECFDDAQNIGNPDVYLVSCPPRLAYEPFWKKMVQAVVERYDGDKVQDMPGLLPGFRIIIQIENEAANPWYWAPDLIGGPNGLIAAQRFLRVLDLSKQGRDAANPATQIIGTSFINPDKLAKCDTSPLPPECNNNFDKRNLAFSKEVLKHPELFDALDVHMFYYYKFSSSAVDAAVQWFHDQMSILQYQKPIYSLESSSSILLDLQKMGQLDDFMAHFPYGSEFSDLESFMAMYKDLSNPANEKYRLWFETEQAKEFPKLFTAMIDNGMTKLIHVQFRDYFGVGWDNVWWNWMGIVRYTGTEENPVVIRKPVYYAHDILARKIAGFTSVETVDFGADVAAYKYNFSQRNPLYIIWAKGKTATIDLNTLLNSMSVFVTPLVIEIGQSQLEPPKNINGITTFTDSPVFVETL